ncbi:LacI family DNA-binding transcriptional regulator [Bifidobacterium sp. ESL0769]|uniref:LacI family DNA-binding transcriptional regulator n=1 Tax=Bifidobacterium sp. ESL0769 TaxID=2983229 RepID=UPI0023F7301E|nr:LacI family DNA-binding transcriptional regulator [Bifidobacterium sp. ESL0769]WEV67483.1 LacI family DNA-binding transcriptional regulator [Bifidobacterium sp. ESL0769]
MGKTTGKATRNDVANLANVSTAVVSYVFNNGPRNVSPQTAQKVRDAAAKLHYQPNSIARALRTGNSKTLGAVINDFTNPFALSIYEKLEMMAAEKGYSMLFATSHSELQKEKAVIKELMNRNVEALFISPCENVTLFTPSNENCRLVIFDIDRKVPNVSTIATDYTKAVQLGMSHLFKHGHTNIAMIIGQSSNGISDGRINGWYQAFKNEGLPAGHIEHTEFSRIGGYKAMLKILDLKDRPTAIFAGSDLIALGALRALHERHIRVPEEIAIISFDGSIDSQYTYPELTVIQQNPQEIARLALEAAIGPNSKPTRHLLEAKLVIRQSCGCNMKTQ